MSIAIDKETALDFLRHLRNADRAAAERLVAAGARHHNPHFAAGMGALIGAAVESAKTFPDRQFELQRVVAEDELVVVHSRVRHRKGEAGVGVVHIFRFEAGRIAELWDLGQAVPADSANSVGMF